MRPREKKVVQARTASRAEELKQREFAKLVERFRNTSNRKVAKRLGDKLGLTVFG